jgi:distribution and morphology protein 31
LREGASGATGERIPGRSSLSKDALKVPSESVHSTSREGFKEKEREERKKAMRFAKAVKTTSDEEEIMRKLEQDQLDEEEDDEEEEDKIVSIDLDLRFKDLKAHVPVSFAPPRPSLPSLTFLEIHDPHKTDYSEWLKNPSFLVIF